MIPIILLSRKGKTMDTIKRSVVAKDSGRGREGWSTGAFKAVKLFYMIL